MDLKHYKDKLRKKQEKSEDPSPSGSADQTLTTDDLDDQSLSADHEQEQREASLEFWSGDESHDISIESDHQVTDINTTSTSMAATSKEVQRMSESLTGLYQSRDNQYTKPLPFFGLDNEDPDTFIERLELHFTLNEVKDEKKPRIFQALMRDSAQRWYKPLDNAIKRDYARLIKEFQEFYNNDDAKYLLQQQLEAIKMTTKESISNYIDRVQRIGQRLQMTDDTTKAYLMRGLSPKYRIKVMSYMPKSLPDTISKIKYAHNEITEKNRLKEGDKEATTSDDTSGENEVATRLARLELLMRQQVNAVSILSPPNTTHPDGRPPQPAQRNPPQNCYYCDRPGHLIKGCFRRQRDQERQQQSGRDSRSPWDNRPARQVRFDDSRDRRPNWSPNNRFRSNSTSRNYDRSATTFRPDRQTRYTSN